MLNLNLSEFSLVKKKVKDKKKKSYNPRQLSAPGRLFPGPDQRTILRHLLFQEAGGPISRLYLGSFGPWSSFLPLLVVFGPVQITVHQTPRSLFAGVSPVGNQLVDTYKYTSIHHCLWGVNPH